MQTIQLGRSDLEVSRIGLGCMRMAQLSATDAERVIQTCLEEGITFFDHADIYGAGFSEEIFGKAVQRSKIDRQNMIIQSKCGIRKGYFDFSKEHIVASVDGSLKRLKTDYLDVLVLHRPDALIEPEEVAETFDTLKKQGKVNWFGVSNTNSRQIELLQKYCTDPLVVNQLQLSLAHTPLIDSGLHVNMKENGSVHHDAELIDYCRLHEITIQPWSPFQIDLTRGLFFGHDDYIDLSAVIRRIAQEKQVAPEAIAIAWLLRHPALMQPIVGSMNSDRLKRIARATTVELTRQEWYELYISAGNTLP